MLSKKELTLSAVASFACVCADLELPDGKESKQVWLAKSPDKNTEVHQMQVNIYKMTVSIL